MSTYDIEGVKQALLEQVAVSQTPREVLKAPQIRELYAVIATLPVEERGSFGREVNEVKQAVEAAVQAREIELESADVTPIDITAPWEINGSAPSLLPTEMGTQHPLTKEIERVVDIFTRMGFEAIESRQIDDDHHMFGALNFPPDHPARDGYDTFRTEEGYIPPAHTSTMQHRILKAGKAKLEAGGHIAAVS